jgi:hypothetical protein
LPETTGRPQSRAGRSTMLAGLPRPPRQSSSHGSWRHRSICQESTWFEAKDDQSGRNQLESIDYRADVGQNSSGGAGATRALELRCGWRGHDTGLSGATRHKRGQNRARAAKCRLEQHSATRRGRNQTRRGGRGGKSSGGGWQKINYQLIRHVGGRVKKYTPYTCHKYVYCRKHGALLLAEFSSPPVPWFHLIFPAKSTLMLTASMLRVFQSLRQCLQSYQILRNLIWHMGSYAPAI